MYLSKLRNYVLSTFATLSALVIFAAPVKAQDDNFGLCDLLGPIGNPFGCSNGDGQFGGTDVIQEYFLPRVQFALSLIFIGLILFAIFYVIKASITYIQSQGSPDKIAEATKAIRSVFIGLGALFVGIAGILIVLAFFGSGTGGATDINLRCLERPQCCSKDDSGAYTFDNTKDGCASD